eukprot:12304040-Alexandrium_andersonii.AAC.1
MLASHPDLVADASSARGSAEEAPPAIMEPGVNVMNAPAITSLESLFGWPDHFVEFIEKQWGESKVSMLAQAFQGLSYSTAFSGIDSPGCSLLMLEAALAWKLKSDVRTATHRNAIEMDEECAAELSCHPSRPQCLHVNQEDFWHATVRDRLDQLEQSDSLNLDILESIVKCSDKFIKNCAHCRHHGADCPYNQCAMHVAGVPCVDWSPMGKGSREKGRTARVFACWCAQRRKVYEPVVLVECSSRFDPAMLDRMLGDLYQIDHCVLDTRDFGWPGRRKRFWGVLVSKASGLGVEKPLREFSPLFRRVLQCSWRVFIQGRTQEALDELIWAVRRKKSLAFQTGTSVDEFLRWKDSEPDKFWETAFRKALTAFELESLCEYERQPDGLSQAHMLNQNPHAERGVSSDGPIMHTVISNAGIQWASPFNRWFTPRELLLANGIPVTFGLGHVGGSTGFRASSFCSGGTLRKSPRKRQNIQHQAGNTMNTMTVGVMWLFCMLCICKPKDPQQEDVVS